MLNAQWAATMAATHHHRRLLQPSLSIFVKGVMAAGHASPAPGPLEKNFPEKNRTAVRTKAKAPYP